MRRAWRSCRPHSPRRRPARLCARAAPMQPREQWKAHHGHSPTDSRGSPSWVCL